jgi:uncharacterized protein (DUF1778 family)
MTQDRRLGTINVRVNQGNQATIRGTTTFLGSANVQSIVNEALNTAQHALDAANVAINIAQNSYNVSNTKLDITGGEITGSLVVDHDLTVANNITASHETIDAGFF